MSTKRIVYFASGSGSNVENIVRYLRDKNLKTESLILCNKPDAFVLERAKYLEIEAKVFTKSDFAEGGSVLSVLKNFHPDLIVLAGFLWLMPKEIIQSFPGKIINIHPALLPKYGGKGMYGDKVHQAVVDNGEKESGITIHYVNEHYDEGEYILQAKCEVEPSDSYADVAKKVHALEYEHFPQVVESFIVKN